MKKFISLFLAVCMALPLFAQERGNINIPDLKGYVTLKCDFHIHTVFSDGRVTPEGRIKEAYSEGLDAIAITDHVEGVRNKQNFVSHNHSYNQAQKAAKEMDMILIKGAEITRQMPPGHSNAIFLTNTDELDQPDYMDAYRAAKAQNAFIIWNHPCWTRQQPDTVLWWPEHTRLLQQGMMHGIEVVNGNNYSYCAEAHRWSLEKKLTMLGNWDAHLPSQFGTGKRAMTLVFARSRTSDAIYEALMERRTAVYFEEYIIGEEKYLKELFEKALEWQVTKTGRLLDPGELVRITVKNNSGLTFLFRKNGSDSQIKYLRNVTTIPFTVAPDGEYSFEVYMQEGVKSGNLNFIVENFLVEPNKGMKYTVKIEE